MAEWGVWRIEGAKGMHEVVLRLQRWSGLVQLWVDGAPREAQHISYSFDHALTLGEHHAKVAVLYGRGPTLRFELDGTRVPPTLTTAPANSAALLANAPQAPTYPDASWQDNLPYLLCWVGIQASPTDAAIAFALGGLAVLLAVKVLGLKGHPLLPALSVSWGYHGWMIATVLMHPGAWPLAVLGVVGLWLFTWLLPAPKGSWQVAAVVAWSCLGLGLFVMLDMYSREAHTLVLFSSIATAAMTFQLVRGVRKLRAVSPPSA